MKMKKINVILVTILLMITIFLQYNIPAIAYESVIDEHLQEKLSSMESNEVINIAIWLSDIDQNEVSNITEEILGYSLENAEINYRLPKTDLMKNLENYDEIEFDKKKLVKQQMETYLNETKDARSEERKKTNRYIFKRREVSREKYCAYLEKQIEELNINSEKIEYLSKYAPMIVMNATKEDIIELQNKHGIERIYLNDFGYEDCTLETAEAASNIDTVKEIGLTGDGVSVGMVEQAIPQNSYVPYTIVLTEGTISPGEHADNTISILKGNEDNEGVAPNANIYCSNLKFSNVEAMLSYVSLINASSQYSIDNDDGTYNAMDRWIDHLAAYHNVTMICAAGNSRNKSVLSPAKALNTICVGAINDQDTEDKNDDRLVYSSSCFSTIQKPDVLASSSLYNSGTSSSAPLVTGSVALMLEMKPSLLAYPQLIKSIVLASCHRKVSSPSDPIEAMEQGITEMQGAGVFDAYKAISIVGRRQYYLGTFCNETDIDLIQPRYRSENINVSLTWLKENVSASYGHSEITEGPFNDLLLKVFDEAGQEIDESDITNSSTEMVYFDLTQLDGKYKIYIKNKTNNYNMVRYAIAWCMDGQGYRDISDTNGLYIIKNVNSEKYISFFNNMVLCRPSSLSNPYFWLIRSNGLNGGYIMRDGNSGNNLGISDNMINVYQQGASLFPFETSISFLRDTNGTYTITSNYDGYPLTLDFDNAIVNGDSNKIGWNYLPYDDTQKWKLEKVYYGFGDTNMDAQITMTDILSLRQYLANTTTFNCCQEYLADANGDGNITLADVLYVQQYMASYGNLEI